MPHRISDEVSPGHPALPGHFPGNPVVPGVVLLARVVSAVKAAYNCKVAAIAVAKFHTPLKPAERFEIELGRVDDGDIKFRVLRGETLIATGKLKPSSTRGDGP